MENKYVQLKHNIINKTKIKSMKEQEFLKNDFQQDKAAAFLISSGRSIHNWGAKAEKAQSLSFFSLSGERVGVTDLRISGYS